tara:strand:+ start:620 stop:2224 length:1605 start_codon:yes stop_codon:yes gene_type:complete
MAYSYVAYIASGGQTQFTIPFPYIAQAHVKVKINNVANTSFVWLSTTQIQVTASTANDRVFIYRETSPDQRLVDFVIPGQLTEEDLDTAFTQTQFLSQEALDNSVLGIFEDPAIGTFSAVNKKISNLADPTDAQDAVTKSWAETGQTSQLSAATAQAVLSASKASESAVSATNSETSKTASGVSATASATSATESAASAATATTQAALATTNGAAQVALAATQAGLATTNGAAQVTLAATQAGLATTNGAAQVTLATAQAVIATTQAAAVVAADSNAAASATASAASATASAASAASITGAEATATTKASESAASATASANSAAAAAASFDSFDDRYLGAKASEPSTNNDGDALVAGNLYFLTGTGMQVYDGAAWIAASSSGNVSLYSYEYIATAGQTSFSGADVSGQTLSYTANNIHVTYGGLDIPKADYVATNGTTVVLDDGAVVGTIVRIVAFQSFVVANTYTQTQADARYKAIGASEGGPSLGLNSIIRTNANTISENITIPLNTNGMSAGEITIADGYTVTVNGTWSII